MTPLLQIFSLTKHFPVRTGRWGLARGAVHAVDDVSFAIARGETLSVVGESGCGKSTLGRTILQLTRPSSGEIWLDGRRLDTLPLAQLRRYRRQIQVVFQDPFSSLSPRMAVGDIIAEPIWNLPAAERPANIGARVADLLDKVRLPRDAARRYPHEFSGGQRQRVGIARALAAKPDLIICDEAVSALDVSVKAQIANLLADLQDEIGLALLFISHDIAIVEHLSHRVAVMYLGRIVEIGEVRRLFAAPAHPYTRALLSAVPSTDPDKAGRRIVLEGDVPSPISPPSGCRFHTRCPYVFDRCRQEAPVLRERAGAAQLAACHLEALPSVN